MSRTENPDHARIIDKRSKEKNKERKKQRDKKYRFENKEKLRETQRIWKENNPEKVKASAKRYRENHADELREKQREYEQKNVDLKRVWRRQWKKNNPDKIAENSRRSREKNKEAINASNLAYMKDRYLNDPEFREIKKAYARDYGKIWRQEKKDLTRVHTLSRRARLAEAEGTHTAKDIKRIHAAQGFRCAACGVDTKDSFHVDHKTPLSRGGSNWPDNIQILCPHCNVSKWNRTDEEFREWREKLVEGNDNTPRAKKA